MLDLMHQGSSIKDMNIHRVKAVDCLTMEEDYGSLKAEVTWVISGNRIKTFKKQNMKMMSTVRTTGQWTTTICRYPHFRINKEVGLHTQKNIHLVVMKLFSKDNHLKMLLLPSMLQLHKTNNKGINSWAVLTCHIISLPHHMNKA